MKNSSFQIKIEKPCNEKWADMTTNHLGKFCSSCEKNVIDFSKMGDDELIRVLEKMEGKVCGRLQRNQLERIFVASQNRKVSPHLNKILAGLFALGMMESTHLEAQTGLKSAPEMVNTVSSSSDKHIAIQENKNIIEEVTKNIIKGYFFKP